MFGRFFQPPKKALNRERFAPLPSRFQSAQLSPLSWPASTCRFWHRFLDDALCSRWSLASSRQHRPRLFWKIENGRKNETFGRKNKMLIPRSAIAGYQLLGGSSLPWWWVLSPKRIGLVWTLSKWPIFPWLFLKGVDPITTYPRPVEPILQVAKICQKEISTDGDFPLRQFFPQNALIIPSGLGILGNFANIVHLPQSWTSSYLVRFAKRWLGGYFNGV